MVSETHIPVTFILAGSGDASRRLAVLQRQVRKENTENAPVIVWFPGFRSSMRSVKAEALDQWCVDNDLGCLRFDYSGHGESTGIFEESTFSHWLEDACAVLKHSQQKNFLFVGSSMGGWLALQVALHLRKCAPDIQIKGLVLLAPAINFTERLIWDRLPDEIRQLLMDERILHVPSLDADAIIPISWDLIQDGRKHLLYKEPLVLDIPVHILQGKQDAHVPWQTALELFEHLASDLVQITFINDADHSLERVQDQEKIFAVIREFL